MPDFPTALATVLANLHGNMSTGYVTNEVAKLMGVDPRAISRRVVASASGHPQAHRGEEFKRFGRTMSHWIWHAPRSALRPCSLCGTLTHGDLCSDCTDAHTFEPET